MAELLELAELAQHDREAEVQVGGRRVDAELGPQRGVAPELAAQVRLGDDVDGARGENVKLLVDAGPGHPHPLSALRAGPQRVASVPKGAAGYPGVERARPV